MSYQTFAAFYDEVMDDGYYDKWLAYTLDEIGKDNRTVLELACGTGKLAVALSKSGHTVTGLDLSDNMLSLAYNRSLEEGEHIQFLQGDMRELSETGLFDAVTCFSDSLCYMKDEKEVLDVFKGVHDALKKGGTFLFDVHSLYKVQTVFPGYQYHDVLNEGAFLWSSFKGDTEGSIEHDLTFFIYEKQTGQYARYDETHKERTYSIDTYKALLTKAGFRHIEVSSNFGQNQVTDTTERIFFSCQTGEESQN